VKMSLRTYVVRANVASRKCHLNFSLSMVSDAEKKFNEIVTRRGGQEKEKEQEIFKNGFKTDFAKR